ncbi:Chitin-inducible gibberellin-responsive protein, putative [Ricinus communis]|uniref:Chitin-inducible gibberellin-responsive protein, putative n=1 Tax=Ricinus communis TaxID=3988 RepID=B9T679_RICCO|nr:Chitin-inducible gibberellin-responsive protein, putative [Ricinus communis]
MDDALLRAPPGAMSGFRFEYGTMSVLPNQHLVNGFKLNHSSVVDPYRSLHPKNAHALSSDSATSTSSSFELDSPDNSDISNVVLKYISDMLMEEELESKNFMFEDCLALQAAEKSFYDVLGQKYPASLDQSPFLDQNIHSLEGTSTWCGCGSHLENAIQVPDLYCRSFSNDDSLLLSESQTKDYARGCCSFSSSRDRKHHQREESACVEGRSNKHSAFSVEQPEDTKIFDEVLLCQARNNDSASCVPQNALQGGGDGQEKNHGRTEGSNRRTARTKKRGSNKRDMMDLWTVLPQCAQAVANDDQTTAKELLRQIKQYSSPFGDGNQRLAHFFANGLEARLAGTGTPGYAPAVNSTTSAAGMLKAYHAYTTACPFQTMSHLYANETIMKLAEKTTRLHIIDFGILYGFQWPCLIEDLSTRHGGPPRLHITGIEFPQPGFRPAERVEETGRRLSKYCERFNVPFEYDSIAQNWESIQYEDFKIDRNEMIVVNCLYRLKNIPDDTMVVNSMRDSILKLMRRINPDIFIHGVVNGTYNAPFFLTRFRDALFHFSALFDMIDSTIPREEPERMMFEKEVFGRYAVNVIACEGGERVERPETYRQWQARNIRAGFRQLPLDQEIMKKVITTVKSNYNKNFIVDEDSQWMLQGWKGRIIYALAVWKPVHD